MNARRRRRAAALAMVVLASLTACRRQPPAPPPTAAEEPTPAPMELVLFFPGDDDLLHREKREVPELPPNGSARVRFVLEELVAGSHSGLAPAIPWPATVEAAFVDRRGNAWVSLSSPPLDAIQGTSGEIALVYGAVSSVVANCPGVERVQLLFGGRQVATFGHLDLSRPIAARPEMVAP